MEGPSDNPIQSNLSKKEAARQKRVNELERKISNLDRTILEGEQRLQALNVEIAEMERLERERVERLVLEAERLVDEKVDATIEEEVGKLESSTKEPTERRAVVTWLQEIRNAVGKALKRRIIKYFFLPIGVATTVAMRYHTPQEYYEMAQNYLERNVEGVEKDDPTIAGLDTLKEKDINTERTTYDFLGPEKLNYKFGYYMTSVFDLSDKTPPRFKIIDRNHVGQIEKAAGITTNLFQKFETREAIVGRLKINENAEEMQKVAVIAYNINTQTIRAGRLGDFDENWLVSQTYETKLDFKLNDDGTINLVYAPGIYRMAPQLVGSDGTSDTLGIGITRDQTVTRIKPYEANRFGILEGGKVIMVCGEKQLQVNGSFADIYRVYEKLKKDYPSREVIIYGLDNGAYNLPIWKKGENPVLTSEEIREHTSRHYSGGTALVLMNDESISPYEYRNTYPEYQHLIEGFTLNPETGEPAVNERSAIVIHHTGNYIDPYEIIRQFKNPANERSAHVLIMKDGSRHLFNDDRYVLAHAGKSDFKDRNAVNFFSLGIEMEGDSTGGKQFTLAQLESMLEYLRPRIERYGIQLEDITTHKIIRNNYIAKNPNEKNVPKKVDLEDKVWMQIRDLIAKKLYSTEKPKVVGDASKLLGGIIYQDALRNRPQAPEFAIAQVKEMLKEFDTPFVDINETERWIREFQ